MPWPWVHSMSMRALTLDFVHTSRRTPWIGVVVLLLGALAVGAAANQERALSGQIELASARLAAISKGGQAKPVQPVDAQAQQIEIRNANEILQQLALPWSDLFKVVETANEKEIALLSIQPDAGKRVLRLSGEAKNFEALLAYIARLEQTPMLSQVYLSNHEVRLQDPQKPVRFALVASWTVQP